MTTKDSLPATSQPVPGRKIHLSSLHGRKRAYPKDRPPDLQLSNFPSSESITQLLTPLSPDILPEHTSPTSPRFRRSRTHSLSSLSLNDFRTSNSRTFWIVLYFLLSFSLTLCNKIVLNQFPFPYSVTALHALGGCIGTWSIIRYEEKVPMLSTGEVVVLVFFSVLYTINIVVSNVSLQLVTVPFHQVVRSSSPFFTLLLSLSLLQSRVTYTKLLSLIPVVAGVGLATYGDYYYTPSGFLLTVLGTFLASLKTVITNILQSPTLYTSGYPRLQLHTQTHKKRTSISLTKSSSLLSTKPETSLFASIPKLRLTPLQLLHLLSPLALFQCTLLALYFGEIDQLASMIRSPPSTSNNTTSPKILPGIFSLLLNIGMAFALNVVNFHTVRKIGALGMSVTANVKQVLTVLSSVVLFNLTITKTNAAGVFLTLVGGAWYARVDHQEKKEGLEVTG